MRVLGLLTDYILGFVLSGNKTYCTLAPCTSELFWLKFSVKIKIGLRQNSSM